MSDSDNDRTDVQAGGEFADPNATITCTTCFSEVRNDNVAKHFNWHVDVGDHTDDAQRERAEPTDAESSSESESESESKD